MDNQLEYKIGLEKLKHQYKTMPESITLRLLISLLISYLLWDWVDHEKIAFWLTLMGAASINAITVYILFAQNNFKAKNLLLWHILSTQSSTIVAAIFSSMIYLLYPSNLEQQVIIILTVAGIASTAVSSLSYMRITIYLYIPTIILPNVYYFLFIRPEHSFFAILLAAHGLFLLANAYRVNRDFDTTIRHQIQAEDDKKTIQSKHEIYQQLFDTAPISIIHYDQNGYCLNTNPAFTKLTQFPPERHIGMSAFDTVRSDEVKKAIQNSLTTGSGYYEGKYWMQKAQVYKHLVMQFAGIRDINGTITSGIAIVQDISDRRANELELIDAKENAIKAKNIKSEFLSRMSHDLRTPMNAILGFTELISIDDNTTKEQKEHLNEISSAGNILLAQINEILDLSRFDKETIAFNLEKINANDLCDKCINLITPLANNANLKIISSYQADEIYVFADKQKFRQCLLNLLSNAIKYSDKKSRDIKVNCFQMDNVVRFEVVDHGIGIDEHDMNQVFQPFSRFSDDKTVEGTGIGLTITETLIDKMDGQIGCQSTLGIGSTFWIELPIVK